MKLPKQIKPITVPVPFKLKSNMGLGDVVTQAARAFGIKQCGGCRKRARLLNNKIEFRGRG